MNTKRENSEPIYVGIKADEPEEDIAPGLSSNARKQIFNLFYAAIMQRYPQHPDTKASAILDATLQAIDAYKKGQYFLKNERLSKALAHLSPLEWLPVVLSDFGEQLRQLLQETMSQTYPAEESSSVHGVGCMMDLGVHIIPVVVFSREETPKGDKIYFHLKPPSFLVTYRPGRKELELFDPKTNCPIDPKSEELPSWLHSWRQNLPEEEEDINRTPSNQVPGRR